MIMTSKFHNIKVLRRILLVPALLLILAAVLVSCNLNGEGIFHSIAQAPEISKEIKDTLSKTADGIIGIPKDSTDNNAAYMLVNHGGSLYAFPTAQDTDGSWKQLSFADADGENVLMTADFQMTASDELHFIKNEDVENNKADVLYKLVVSSLLSDSYASEEIQIDTADVSSNLDDGDSFQFIDDADDKLFYLYSDYSAGSIKANFAGSSGIDEAVIDLQQVNTFHAAKEGTSTYYLFISGEKEDGEDAAILLTYTSTGFGAAEDITADFDDSSSLVSGCLSAAIDGVIYLTAGDFLYTYDTSDTVSEPLKKFDGNYPNDFSLTNSNSVHTAADTDAGIIYFSGNNVLYAFEESGNAETDEITEIETFASGIQDLFFDNDADVLYIARKESWIWKYDPSAAAEKFSQLF